MAADNLLDVYGVAHLLGLSPRSAYRLMSDGTLPATGWPRLIPKADVDEYLRRCRIQPGQLRHLNQYPAPTSQPPQG